MYLNKPLVLYWLAWLSSFQILGLKLPSENGTVPPASLLTKSFRTHERKPYIPLNSLTFQAAASDGMLDFMYDGPSVLREIIKKSKLGGMKSSNPVYEVMSSNSHSNVGLLDKSKNSIIATINNGSTKPGLDHKASEDKEKIMNIDDTYTKSKIGSKVDGTENKTKDTVSFIKETKDEPVSREESPAYQSTWKYINNISRLKNKISHLVNSSTEKMYISNASENKSSSHPINNAPDDVFEHYDLSSFRPNTKPSKTSNFFPEPSTVQVSFNIWSDQDVGKPEKVNLGNQKFEKPQFSGKPLTDSNIIWIFTTQATTISTPNYNDSLSNKTTTPSELAYYPVDDTSTELSTKFNINTSTTKMVNSISQTSLPEIGSKKPVTENLTPVKASGMVTSDLGLKTTSSELLTTEAVNIPSFESPSVFLDKKVTLTHQSTDSPAEDENFLTNVKREDEGQSQSTYLPLAAFSEKPQENSVSLESSLSTTANVIDLIRNTRFKIRSSTTTSELDNHMVTKQTAPVGKTITTLKYDFPASENTTVSEIEFDSPLAPENSVSSYEEDKSSTNGGNNNNFKSSSNSKLSSTTLDPKINFDLGDANHTPTTIPETSEEILSFLESKPSELDSFTIQTSEPIWVSTSTTHKGIQIKETTMTSEVPDLDISSTEASTLPNNKQVTDSTEPFLSNIDSTINVFDSTTQSTTSIDSGIMHTSESKLTLPSQMNSDLLGVNIVVNTIDTKASHSSTELKGDSNHNSMEFKVTNSTESSITTLQQDEIFNTLFEFEKDSLVLSNNKNMTGTNNSDKNIIKNHSEVEFATEGSVPLVQLNVWNYLAGNVKLKKPEVPEKFKPHISHNVNENYLKPGSNKLKDKFTTETNDEQIIIPSNLYEFVLQQSGNSSKNENTKEISVSNEESVNKKTPILNEESPNKESFFSNEESFNTENSISSEESPNKESSVSTEESPKKESFVSIEENPSKGSSLSNEGPNKESSISMEENPNGENSISNEESPSKESSISNEENPNNKNSISNEENPNKEGSVFIEESSNKGSSVSNEGPIKESFINSTSDNELVFNLIQSFNVPKNSTRQTSTTTTATTTSTTTTTDKTLSITVTEMPKIRYPTPASISNIIRPIFQINHQSTNLNSNIYNNENNNQNIININSPTSLYSNKVRPTLFINNTEYNINNGSNIIKTNLKVSTASTSTMKTSTISVKPTQKQEKPTENSLKGIDASTENSLITKSEQKFSAHSKNKTQQTIPTVPSKSESPQKYPEIFSETENQEKLTNLSKNQNQEMSSDDISKNEDHEFNDIISKNKNQQNSTDKISSNNDNLNESTDDESIPFFSDVDSETLVNEYLKRVSIISKLFEKEDVKDPEISSMIENLALQSLLSFLLQRKTSNLTSEDSKQKFQKEAATTVATTTVQTTFIPTMVSSTLSTSYSLSDLNKIDDTKTNSKISNDNNSNEYAINIFSKLIIDSFDKVKSPNLLVTRPDYNLVNPISTKIETYISPSHNINRPLSDNLMLTSYPNSHNNNNNNNVSDTNGHDFNLKIIEKVEEEKLKKKPSKFSFNYDMPTLLEEDYDLMDDYPFDDYSVKEEIYPPSSTNINSQSQVSSNATTFTDTIMNSVTKVTQMISGLVPSDITFQKCLSSTGCAFALASSLAIGATGALAVPFVIPFGRKKKQMNTEVSRIFYVNKNKELEEEFERILKYLATKTGETEGHNGNWKIQDGDEDKQTGEVKNQSGVLIMKGNIIRFLQEELKRIQSQKKSSLPNMK